MLDIDEKSATVEFHVENAQRASELKRLLAKQFKLLDSSEGDKSVKVKIAV